MLRLEIEYQMVASINCSGRESEHIVKRGPSTEPCGTPLESLLEADADLLPGNSSPPDGTQTTSMPAVLKFVTEWKGHCGWRWLSRWVQEESELMNLADLASWVFSVSVMRTISVECTGLKPDCLGSWSMFWMRNLSQNLIAVRCWVMALYHFEVK